MNITITGSLGNISKPLTKELVKGGHNVKVVTSSSKTAKEISTLGAIPLIGSIEDVSFLTEAFKGADAIYIMTPNNFGAADQRAYMNNVGRTYTTAIKNSKVKSVVSLSSIGAHLAEGTGPIKGLYDTEKLLNELIDVNIIHLRAGFFFTNFYNDIPLIQNLGFMGSNYSADTLMVLVHPKDIASEITSYLEKDFVGKHIRYVYSDEQTSATVAAKLGQAIGNSELKWVQFTNDQLLDGMLTAGLPEAVAKNYIEMGDAMGEGLLSTDFNLHKPEPRTTKLDEFAKEFATKFNQANS